MWVGHGNDLALVRWVGQDFLITGHRSVETDLATGRGYCAESFSVEYGAVLQSQNRILYCAHPNAARDGSGGGGWVKN